MTTMQNLTRAGVERAEPLTFPAKRTAVVHLAYRGVGVDVSLDNANVAEVEKLVDSLLVREGWAGAAAPGAGERAPKPQREKAPEVTRFKDDGTPICPTHGSAMREGRHGWFCPRKTDDGEYCKARA